MIYLFVSFMSFMFCSTKGDMKCVVLFKKDVSKRRLVLFEKEAARENPLWRRASEASGGGREVYF